MARIMAAGAFVITLLVCYDYVDPYSIGTALSAVIKASVSGVLFWFAGLIISDIILKGLVSDIQPDSEHLVEGGLLQRIYLFQQSLVPGSGGNSIRIQNNADSGKKGEKKSDKNRSSQ
ncbi:MAG: hypothetical protein ACOCW1_02295 [Chitinispirillaceae bacterium]